MKIFIKILLNVCIIILAFFLGRVSNVCITNNDYKNAKDNCDCDVVNNGTDNTGTDDKSTSGSNYDLIDNGLDAIDDVQPIDVNSDIDNDANEYTNDNSTGDGLLENEQDVGHEESEYNIE